MSDQRNVLIDTEAFGNAMRERIFDGARQAVMLARMSDAKMSDDRFHQAINCSGFGRIRHYERYSIVFSNAMNDGPWKPVLRGHPFVEHLKTQVFQVAACNWRCWYCFVDDNRLSGDLRYGRFFTAAEIVDMFLSVTGPDLDVLDISGGEPSLVPELLFWIMQELEERGLRGRFWIWTDENFSTRQLWKSLSPKQIRYMASFPRHSRVGCFKGIDSTSFSETTGAAPSEYDIQFAVCKQLIREGFDVYAYVTLTGIESEALIEDSIERFLDRLEDVHPLFALRTIPLKVAPFSATRNRLTSLRQNQIHHLQFKVYAAWSRGLRRRFSPLQLNQHYHDVAI